MHLLLTHVLVLHSIEHVLGNDGEDRGAVHSHHPAPAAPAGHVPGVAGVPVRGLTPETKAWVKSLYSAGYKTCGKILDKMRDIPVEYGT